MKRILALLTPLFFLFMMAGSPAYAGFAGQASVQPTVTTTAKPATKAEVKPTKKGVKHALKHILDDNKTLAIILSFFCPPLAVYLYEGDFSTHAIIALVLWLLFWVPGVIYALYVILKG